MKILVVEDQQELMDSIIEFIGEDNYSFEKCLTFIEADKQISLHGFECAIIDLMLPDGAGLELVEKLKKIQPNCGIIIITAKNTLDDKLTGFNLGADDYLTKPFHLAELNARLISVLRRRNFEGNKILILDEITIDIESHEVKVNNQIIELTKREFDLLLYLASNKARVITKETLVEHTWGEEANSFDNFDFVYTHIKNLRKKLIENGAKDHIQSIYGIGYKFNLK